MWDNRSQAPDISPREEGESLRGNLEKGEKSCRVSMEEQVSQTPD